MFYVMRKAASPPSLYAGYDSSDWSIADTLEISSFRPESSDHRPVTRVRALYDSGNIYILFDVQDKYVRSVQTEFQDPVCTDSCVEFFCQPAGCRDYLNFEFNCGGTFLVYHIIDPTRTRRGLKAFEKLTPEDAALIQVYHSMPEVVEPEIAEETHWILAAKIPLSLFEKYCKVPGNSFSGSTWRANFYKCGDRTSHPHWASWQPVSEKNFHLPECFGEIVFA